MGLFLAPHVCLTVFSPVNQRVGSLTVVTAYGPNGRAEHAALLEALGWVLESADEGLHGSTGGLQCPNGQQQ